MYPEATSATAGFIYKDDSQGNMMNMGYWGKTVSWRAVRFSMGFRAEGQVKNLGLRV